MANFSKAEVDALSKTLWALSSRKMEVQYRRNFHNVSVHYEIGRAA